MIMGRRYIYNNQVFIALYREIQTYTINKKIHTEKAHRN